MIIDINSSQSQSSDSGTNRPYQEDPLMSMVRNVVKSCKAMSSYEAACALITEVFQVAAGDESALQELIRGTEEVKTFFEKRNTPQPSITNEGCNVVIGGSLDGKLVGKSMGIDVNCPGNLIANQINSIKDDKHDGEIEE